MNMYHHYWYQTCNGGTDTNNDSKRCTDDDDVGGSNDDDDVGGDNGDDDDIAHPCSPRFSSLARFIWSAPPISDLSRQVCRLGERILERTANAYVLVCAFHLKLSKTHTYEVIPLVTLIASYHAAVVQLSTQTVPPSRL